MLAPKTCSAPGPANSGTDRVHHIPDERPGNTPLDPEEAAGLIPVHLATQAQLNEWEQRNILAAYVWAGRRRRGPVLDIDFLRRLHRKMFDATWRWAGTFRTTGKNIGVPPHEIATGLHDLLKDVEAWIEHDTFSSDEIALRFHHRLVQIHPFPNGNGRHARLATDLLLESLGRPPFSWGLESIDHGGAVRNRYLAALRSADRGDTRPLAAFVRS